MTNRPAETTSALGSVVLALIVLFGIDLSEDQVAALLVIVGFIPGVVTLIVSYRRGAAADPMK